MVRLVRGRHPNYEAVRNVDVGAVMEPVTRICEAGEWAGEAPEVLPPYGWRHRCSYRRCGCSGEKKCAVCWRVAVWPVLCQERGV